MRRSLKNAENMPIFKITASFLIGSFNQEKFKGYHVCISLVHTDILSNVESWQKWIELFVLSWLTMIEWISQVYTVYGYGTEIFTYVQRQNAISNTLLKKYHYQTYVFTSKM